MLMGIWTIQQCLCAIVWEIRVHLGAGDATYITRGKGLVEEAGDVNVSTSTLVRLCQSARLTGTPKQDSYSYLDLSQYPSHLGIQSLSTRSSCAARNHHGTDRRIILRKGTGNEKVPYSVPESVLISSPQHQYIQYASKMYRTLPTYLSAAFMRGSSSTSGSQTARSVSLFPTCTVIT
jgi:hypothetical protein